MMGFLELFPTTYRQLSIIIREAAGQKVHSANCVRDNEEGRCVEWGGSGLKIAIL